jgi:hypothetical protein
MNILKLSLTIAVAITILQPVYAAPFNHTPEYAGLDQRSYQLQNRDFRTDPAFIPYCAKYARVANRQAQRRTNRCANHIHLTNSNIRARWEKQYWNHRSWCESVSSHTSGNENRIRESQLRSCINNLPAQLTRQQCKHNDKFHKSAASGNINFVRRCLDIGLNVNLRERNNWTALHSAARNGRLNVVRLLVQRGAFINARDINNRTPLDQAKIANHWAVVNYLLSRNAVSLD